MKAADLWNNWFTMTHENNVNRVLAPELNGPINGRRWKKLNRNEERSRSTQAIIPHEQIERLKSSTKTGQSQSTNTLISTKHQTKLKIATKLSEKLLQASYRDDENSQKEKLS